MFSNADTLLSLESSKDMMVLLRVSYLLRQEAALADCS